MQKYCTRWATNSENTLIAFCFLSFRSRFRIHAPVQIINWIFETGFGTSYRIFGLQVVQVLKDLRIFPSADGWIVYREINDHAGPIIEIFDRGKVLTVLQFRSFFWLGQILLVCENIYINNYIIKNTNATHFNTTTIYFLPQPCELL